MASTETRAAAWVTALLLAATALLGVAHVALLPPWEGFDETAHWSYLQQLADTGRPPRYGHDDLARDTDLYGGPSPYSGAPPFEHPGRPSYRSWRQGGAAPIQGGPTRFEEGSSANWQAQHPPLYYLALVPLYRATHGLDWVGHLLALRLASFAFAFAGFAIGVIGTRRLRGSPGAEVGVWTAPIMAGWPLLFPQFIPEFARLGNDSLCLLFMGAAWPLVLRRLCGRGGWIEAGGLGALLGLGLLTKAFFLPILAGTGVLLLAGWWSSGRRPMRLAQAAVTGAVALAVGGWWYVEKALETGSLTGSDEFIRLHQSGGMAALAAGFSPDELVRGLAVLPATFVWAGTWSLARLPEALLLVPLLLVAVALAGYAGRLRKGGLVVWAPLAFGLPMAAGLVYHVFVWMAGTSAVTPGWYFHILAAPLGFAVALGWRWPRMLGALAAATGLYTALAWAFQLSMFSGCAAKLGEDKHYALQGASCFVDLHALAGLAHPGLGLAALALGAASAVAAGLLAWRAWRPAETPELSALQGGEVDHLRRAPERLQEL